LAKNLSSILIRRHVFGDVGASIISVSLQLGKEKIFYTENLLYHPKKEMQKIQGKMQQPDDIQSQHIRLQIIYMVGIPEQNRKHLKIFSLYSTSREIAKSKTVQLYLIRLILPHPLGNLRYREYFSSANLNVSVSTLYL